MFVKEVISGKTNHDKCDQSWTNSEGPIKSILSFVLAP